MSLRRAQLPWDDARTAKAKKDKSPVGHMAAAEKEKRPGRGEPLVRPYRALALLLGLTFQKAAQSAAAARVAQLAQRDRFNLANTLAGITHLGSHLFQSVRLAVFQAKAQ